MDTCSIPSQWKTHTTMPLYKSGCRTDQSNYRPIALMSIAAKIMETIMDDQMRSFFAAHGNITEKQHGFMRGRSCITNLLTSLDDWTKAADQGSSTDVIYFDISKAFDTVNHSILLEKLHNFGITGPLLKWLKIYLEGREFRVRVNGSLSSWKKLRTASRKVPS